MKAFKVFAEFLKKFLGEKFLRATKENVLSLQMSIVRLTKQDVAEAF